MNKRSSLRFFLRSTRHQRGISLIETMVALAIGMLMTLIIYQLYANFEGQKRTTGSGGAAQTSGMMSLLAMERDIRMAAWSMNNEALMGCTKIYSGLPGMETSTPASTSTKSPLAPVRIKDGGDDADSSDTITVRRGVSVAGAAPVIVDKVMKNDAAELQFGSTAAFKVKDIVVVATTAGLETNCTVGEVTLKEGVKIERSPSTPDKPNINPKKTERDTWPDEKVCAQAFSLGEKFFHHIYSVDKGDLVQTANDTTTYTVGSNIVSIKAAYGIAPAGSQKVTEWVRAKASGSSGGTDWSNPTPADVRRIKAIRLAVLSRSPLLEKPDESGACTTTSDPPVAWKEFSSSNTRTELKFNLSGDWRCYRYRVYESIIPLRNVVWAKV